MFTPSSFYLPAQIADAAFSGPSLIAPPSSLAWRLFLALVDHAGAENGAEAAHIIALDDLQGQGVHFSTAPDLLGIMGELRTASLTYGGGEAFHLIDWASVLTVDDGRFLRWKWTDAVRSAFAKPEGWAKMNREALRAMPRRYAMRLYALAALRRSDRRHEDVFTIDQLRARLGVPSGTLPASGSLVTTLRRAAADVNKATGLRLAVRTIRRGRYVEAVEVTWRGKPAYVRAMPKRL